MKKTFISPKAEVKAMETEALLQTGSTVGVSTTQVGGTSSTDVIQAGAKMGGISTIARGSAWAMGKMEF